MRWRLLEHAIDKLSSINWNFENRNRYDHEDTWPINCRKYYSYPATFIPEIPFSLIEILSKKGDKVLDPFGGIGTTFLQALIQERRAFSIDNNQIASHINKDFFNLMNPNVNLEQSMRTFIERCAGYVPGVKYSDSLNTLRKELSDWYHKDTLNEIAFLIQQYDDVRKPQNQLEESLFHLCLSNILTTVSSQNGGWAYMADNVKPHQDKIVYKPAIERFIMCMKQVVRDFEEYKRFGGEEYRRFFERISSTQCIWNENFIGEENFFEKEEIDLIVTSPPYPKMIDYIKSQRLTFYLEESDLKENLRMEIGARYLRNKKETVPQYIESMKKCNEKMSHLLKKKGFLCYILPEFSEKNDEERSKAIYEVIEHCISLGFERVYEISRAIPGTQRANNIKWASLKKEKILVLEKK